LEGNPGKRRIPAEVQLDPALPEPPRELTPLALDEWNRLAPELFRAGILTDADRGALAAYCQSWGDWVNARQQLIRDGIIVETPNGFKQPSPWLSIANKAMANFMRYSSEFGLTPASRVRLQIDPGDGDNPDAQKAKKIFGS
jgi:P27 family predicted phage terminase small subunit